MRHLEMEMLKLILLLLTIVTSSGSNVCQNKCICSEEEVDCSSSGLNRVPDTPLQLDQRKLNLTKNFIGTITSEDFKDLINLVSLDISFNSIDYIAKESFSSLKSLRILKMGHNLLNDLPADVFSENNFLQELYLNNNNLYLIPSLPFSLVRLVLKNSGISEIPPLSLPNLNYIDISNSRLKDIPLETQKSLSNVQTVFADSNPWKCSAHFERLACWLFYKSNSGARMIRCSFSTGRRNTYYAAKMQVECKKYKSSFEPMTTSDPPYSKLNGSIESNTENNLNQMPITNQNIENNNEINKENKHSKDTTENRRNSINKENTEPEHQDNSEEYITHANENQLHTDNTDDNAIGINQNTKYVNENDERGTKYNNNHRKNNKDLNHDNTVNTETVITASNNVYYYLILIFCAVFMAVFGCIICSIIFRLLRIQLRGNLTDLNQENESEMLNQANEEELRE